MDYTLSVSVDNNAFYSKAPFKALKDTAHNNNSTTKTGGNLVQIRINT